MSKSYKTNSQINRNDINECSSKALQYSLKNLHGLALEFYLKSINLLKNYPMTDEDETLQNQLQNSYQFYCYHANALRQYELTIKLVKDNYLEDLHLFFDWSFFYCEALLNMQKYNEYEQTISKLKSIGSEYNNAHSIKEILLTIEGEKYFLQKKYNEAISCYEEANKNIFFTDKNRLFYYKYALATYKIKDYKKSLFFLDAIIRVDQYFYDAYILKLKIFMKQQDISRLDALTNYLENFFININISIHVYLYMMYIYALIKLDNFYQNRDIKIKYISAAKYLSDETCTKNVSIKLLNKAYILYFDLNAYIKDYDKNDLILYPKNIYSKGEKAIVYDGILNKEKVAIKKYDFDLNLKRNNEYEFNIKLQHVFNEVLTLQKLKNINNSSFMHMKCTFLVNKKQFLYIVSPLVKGVSLHNVLHMKEKIINSETKLKIISQIADEIQVLHKNQIRYLNLNSHNILLIYHENTNYYNKLILTGFSKANANKLDEESLNMYSAPELFYDNPYISYHADIYSFGILMCEILTNEKLFDGLDLGELKKRKNEGYFPNFELFEQDWLLKQNQYILVSIIMECLEIDYKNRIDIDNVTRELRKLIFKK